MRDDEIREIGQQIIDGHIDALRALAEYDHYGRPEEEVEEELISDELDDDWDEEQFGKLIREELQREAEEILKEIGADITLKEVKRNYEDG